MEVYLGIVASIMVASVLGFGSIVIRHTTNSKAHVSERNGYVSMATCDAKNDAVLRELSGLRDDVAGIRTMLTERN